jgi:hypothetical protein
MKKIAFLISIAGLFNACTKVIDINLNSVAPQYVVEAALIQGDQDFVVKVSKTSDYFGVDQPTPVTNAQITLKRNNDAPFKILHDKEGFYKLRNVTGIKNSEYTLTVQIDGKTFVASDYMPSPVKLDSVSRTRLPRLSRDPKFPADSFQINCYFKDPPNDTNYYRIKNIKNGIPQDKSSDLVVFQIRLSDGKDVNIPIFSTAYKLQDSVNVELISMDKKMYNYFNTLGDVIDGGGSAAPANPVSNFTGGCLGYFGAFSSSKLTVIVK